MEESFFTTLAPFRYDLTWSDALRLSQKLKQSVGLWRSWERASMAWKRSSVRTRPGPPNSQNHHPQRHVLLPPDNTFHSRECPVEISGCTDQSQMGKGLREISQMPAIGAQLF